MQFRDIASSPRAPGTSYLCWLWQEFGVLASQLKPLPASYPVGKTQIREYFRKLSERLQRHVAAGPEMDAGDHGETEGGTGENEAEAVEMLGAIERANKSSGCGGSQTDEDRTKQLTTIVEEEIRNLQRIMYHFPKTPGGVPDAFLGDRTGENAATLEKDGVEEDHDRNLSNRTKDSVVITIED